MSEKPKWCGVCDIHGLTQESDDYEFILYHAIRCCGKYAMVDRDGWEKKLERDRAMVELSEKQKEVFKSGKGEA